MKAFIYPVESRVTRYLWGVIFEGLNSKPARIAFHPFSPPFKPGATVKMYWGLNHVELQGETDERV